MQRPPKPENEDARLASLREHQLLDSGPEEVYDDITRIASEICGTPISLLTIIDENRQWFKSKQGLVVSETPREDSFCAHAILKPEEIFVVPDARYDDRFHDNPLTTGEPYVVFYAGVPVTDANGNALGALCIIDDRPRDIPENKLRLLKSLGKLVNVQFELRKTKMALKTATEKVVSLTHTMDIIQYSTDELIKVTSNEAQWSLTLGIQHLLKEVSGQSKG